jgi:hypothetical protein
MTTQNILTTTTTTSDLSGSTILSDAMRQLRRRAIGVGVGAACSWGVVAAIIAILAFAWVDLVVELSAAVRLACVIVALLVAVLLATRLMLAAMRAGSALLLARRLDEVAGSKGQILAGVDLADPQVKNSNPDNAPTPTLPRSTGRGSEEAPLTTGLAQLAVRHAAAIVRDIAPTAAVPGKTLVRPLFAARWIAVAIVVIALVAPRLVATQWLRFADPFGDHPPYSRMTFSVDPGNTSVIYGGSIDVRATVGGGVADRMELVLSGSENEPLPMFPEGDGKWRATVANVTTPQTYLVRSGRARTPHYDLSVVTVPKLADVRFKVQLPAYTHRPPYDGPLPQNGLSGLAGTTVEVHAKSNRPLRGGTIAFTPLVSPTTSPTTAPATPSEIAMTPIATGASEVAGTFQIRSSGRISLGVTDVDGQRSTDSLSTSVTLLNDQRPIVRMISPKPNSFATPDALVKVEAMAEDDFGLSKVSIFRGLNDSRPRATDVPVPTPPPTQFTADAELRLGDYGLAPGDVIQLFARAEDNDPAGAKGSESSIVTLRIVSQRDMDRMIMAREGMEALQSKYAAAERRLENIDAELQKLEKELAAADPNSKVAEETRKKIAELADRLAKAAADVQKLADHEMPFDIDHALSQQLKDIAKTLADAAGDAKNAAKPGIGCVSALDTVRDLRKRIGKQRDDVQQNADAPLEHLAKIFPLMEDQARYLDIYQRQKDLADRLSSVQGMNGGDDPQLKARMRDLEDEQRQLDEDLRQLLDDIFDHVAQLPADDKRLDPLRDTAKKFATAVGASPAAGQMQLAESALAEFTGSPAQSHARDAAETLEKFISHCNGMGDQAGMCLKFQPKLSQGLGNSVQQMLESMGLSSGIGEGGGGGYSAMRNSLMNVGLYGTIPLHGRESGGQRGGQADRGHATNADGEPDANDNPEGAGAAAKQQASGQADAPVPAQYKKRVGDYFQRVSDELSE